MDAHKAAKRTIEKEAGVSLNNYCYCARGTEPKYLMFDVTATNAQKVVCKKFKDDEFEYTIGEEAERVKQGIFEIKVYYTPAKVDSLHDDITAGGTKKYGVISPDGKFYECGYAGHNNLEYWLQERGLLADDKRDAFEWYGWLKLSGSAMSECEFLFDEQIDDYDFSTQKTTVLKTNHITDAQVDAMIAYIESLGREYVNFNFRWYTLESLKKLKELEGDFIDFDMEHSIDLKDGSDELYKTKDSE